MEPITAGHSYNLGDLLCILPGLRQLYWDSGRQVRIYQRIGLPAHYYDGQVNSTVNKEGQSVCINDQLFEMIKPLIMAQDYIEGFEKWEGQDVELDYNKTRDSRAIPQPNSPLFVWSEAIFPQTATDLSVSWVRVNSSITQLKYKNKIIINRTQRYQNPYITYYFLKPFEKDILFSGTEAEHQDFCTQFNLELEHLKVDNFYQLAQIIFWCKFGIFNQSFHFHLANAMGSKRVLELCAPFANTFVTGANGYQFYLQGALEFYFNKLNK